MSCNSCSTSKDGVPNGCKSNGNCASGTCGSGNKLAVFDWLSNMTLPTGEAPFNIYEVRFKNGRKHFFKNTEKLTISMGDVVAVEGLSGHDIGIVSLAGELVKVQMKKRKVTADSEDVKKIYRKASQKDIDIWHAARDREQETQRKGREIISRLALKMKLSDVEYQGDGTKATFYYTADERVDFRQLIRDLAGTFSIRVEMRQVGMRQEAARLGGVGSCGRELCCSTWLTDFRKVNTAAARYQQLSLNPLKLAGQCGKLKCCLNFELDTYLDALQSFPKQDKILKTEKGDAIFVKMDIFKKMLWYTYKEESFKWFRLSLEQVQEIIELNKNDELALPLEEYELEITIEPTVDFENVVGQDSLTRFDTPKKSRNNARRKSRKTVNKKETSQPVKQQPNKRPQRTVTAKKEIGQPNKRPQRVPATRKEGEHSVKKQPNKRPQRVPAARKEGEHSVKQQPNKRPQRTVTAKKEIIGEPTKQQPNKKNQRVPVTRKEVGQPNKRVLGKLPKEAVNKKVATSKPKSAEQNEKPVSGEQKNKNSNQRRKKPSDKNDRNNEKE
ncbi:regulatory iron-sulfur-containing complex subunit RicT [Tenacibaculum aestuariivivum]|uniref:regulatory iron-sulfur-containing complex subunit RicT n=1 Tax=Tenacibaculum aestuariivivum TaxID=2006131 RepID=UPI003AB3DB8A